MKRNCKKLLILLFCIAQMLTGCQTDFGRNSDNYNIAIEVLYQKEDYTPSYAYQIFRTVNYDTGIMLPMGMEMKVPESTHMILDTDRKVGKIVFESREAIKNTMQKKVNSQFSEAELDNIGVYCNYIELENATYILRYGNSEEFGDYTCHLFKFVADELVDYVTFEITYDIMSESDKVAGLAAYSDNTICVCDSKWFDDDLKAVDKEQISYEEYILSKAQIRDALCKTEDPQLVELANDIDWLQYTGRYGETYYGVLSRESEALGTGDVFIVEVDTEQTLLSVIQITGMEYIELVDIVPKIQGAESNEYFDVMR